jgi:hypothetical protein
MLRLRDENPQRSESRTRFARFPRLDPPHHCIGHLEAVASVALLPVMLSTIGCGNRRSNVQSLFDFKPSLKHERQNHFLQSHRPLFWASRRASDPQDIATGPHRLFGVTSAIGKTCHALQRRRLTAMITPSGGLAR